MDPIRGVPLVQVAAVHAAVAEGFVLDAVLDVEGLPKTGWFEAEASWKRRLVEEPEVFSVYSEELRIQQNRLGRRVTPIDDDVAEWVAFLRLYGDHPVPFDYLVGLGLELPDLARLSRSWSERFEADKRLAKKAAKIAAKLATRADEGQLIDLAPIAVHARSLIASSVAGTFVVPAMPSTAQADNDDEQPGAPALGLDRYAALCAELAAADAIAAKARTASKNAAGRNRAAARAIILDRFDLDEEAAEAIGCAWDSRLDSDAELRADFRALCRHYAGGIARRGGDPPPKRRERRAMGSMTAMSRPYAAVAAKGPASRKAPWSPDRAPMTQARPSTAAMPAMTPSAAIPFKGQITSVSPITLDLPPLSSRSPLDTTGDLIPALLDEEIMPFDLGIDSTGELSLELLGLDTLPFDGEPSAALLAASAAIASTPHDDVGQTATMTSEDLEIDDPLPFEDDDEDAPTLDAGADSTAVLTVDQLELDDDALPFSDDAPSVPASSKTLVDEPHAEVGATAVLTVDQLGMADDDALPFSDDDDAVTQDASTLDGTAFMGPLDLGLDDDDEPTSMPTLTLEQFASFQAELAVAPLRAQAIRARYHIADEAMQRRVEQSWQSRFVADPRERRRYADKLAHFRAWLASR
jgi:hypothetical protein